MPPRSEVLTDREMQIIARAIADPRRFEILKQVAAGECVACADLRMATEITAATMSHHLKELESAGLVEFTKRGKFVDITFVRPRWQAYLSSLNSL